MKLNKIKPIFGKKYKSIEELYSESADRDFIEAAKSTFAKDDISDYSDNEISKWLIASDLDVDKALDNIKETLIWRKTIKIQSILHHDYSDMLELNKIVLQGKSMDGSLLLWWMAKSSWSSTFSGRDRELQYFIYLLEKSRKAESRKEGMRMTLVFDISGVKSEKSEIDYIFSLISITGKHFPETISRIFIFPKSAFTSMIIKIASGNLQSELSSRITLSSGPEILFGSINPDNILTKYGGKLALVNDEAAPTAPVKPIIEEIWAAPPDDI
jgi:hypothetical protein